MAASDTPIATDDAGAAALATVLQTVEEGGGTVAWSDVRDDIDREHWGAMLEQGVLVPAAEAAEATADGDRDDRFVLENPTAVRETLENREFAPPEPKGWSRADGAAAAGACSLVAGYTTG